MNTVLDIRTPLWDRLDEGRHALDEDAVLTPIFSALTRGEWRQQQRQSAAIEHFRRDPLTAPLPVVTALPTAVTRTAGRHHRVA